MIHDVGVELQAAMKVRGCPFAVVDREWNDNSTWSRERVVIEHDEKDSFGFVRGQRANGHHAAIRRVGIKLTVYARSSRAGAREHEHRERAEAVVDHVILGLVDVCAARRQGFDLVDGGFEAPADLEGSAKWGGAVYVIRLTMERAVIDRTWAGAIGAEYTLAAGKTRSTTKVSLAGGPDDDGDPTTVPATAETSCG